MELDLLQEEARFTTSEVEGIFDTRFYSIIPHINIRRDAEDNRYCILFTREEGHYDHVVADNHIKFIGTGLEGDQDVDANRNSVLIESIEDPIPLHVFHQEADFGRDRWKYLGLVRVTDYGFERRDGRQVIIFDLIFVEELEVEIADPQDSPDYEGTSAEAVKREREQLQRDTVGEPKVKEGIEYSKNRRIARDFAFREIVRRAYDSSCAICGKSRRSPDGQPEVEAAHIYPKREGGSDDPRNGIAFCKFHHWAYDSGWMAISRDLRIKIRDLPHRDTYEDMAEYKGKKLRIPDDEGLKPHRRFLDAELSRRRFF